MKEKCDTEACNTTYYGSNKNTLVTAAERKATTDLLFTSLVGKLFCQAGNRSFHRQTMKRDCRFPA